MGLNFTVDTDFRGQAPRCSKHGQIYPADKIIAIQQIKIYWLEYILTAGLIAIYPLDSYQLFEQTGPGRKIAYYLFWSKIVN